MILLPTVVLSLLSYRLTIRSIEDWAQTVTNTALDAAHQVTEGLEGFYTYRLSSDVDVLAYDAAVYRAYLAGDREVAIEALSRLPIEDADSMAIYDASGRLWLAYPAESRLPATTHEFLPPIEQVRELPEEAIVASLPYERMEGDSGITLREKFLCAFPLVDGDTRRFQGVVVVSKDLPFSRVLDDRKRAVVESQKSQARDRAFVVLVTSGGILLLAMVPVSLWLSRRMTRSIAQLVAATREIGRGNLDYQMPELRTPEFAQVAQAFGTMTDELRLRTEELRRAEKSEVWREVAQKLAHELRNPLTPIRLSSQRLRRRYETDPDGVGEILMHTTEVIERQVTSLNRLLDEFSRLARLPEAAFAEVSLNDVVARTTELFAELAPSSDGQASVVLSVEVPDDLPLLRADEEQLARAMQNLVKNAVQAMAEGGSLRIAAAMEPDAPVPMMRIEIDDTGCGIAPEVRDRLFLPHVSTKRDGHGLGLAIVRKIVEDHAGSIQIEPNPAAQGTRVVMRLPAVPPA